MKKKKSYKLISEDLQKNLIEFLDEIQIDAASSDDKEALHMINFCNWAINELLNSHDAFFKDTKSQKSRDDYIEETFMDWNLPEMSDEEYEKLVDKFDDFIREWEKEHLKKNKKYKKQSKTIEQSRSKKITKNDISSYMSLDEIKEYLLEDPDLTNEEAFELYYDEYLKTYERSELKKSKSMNQMLKNLGIKKSSD